MATYVQLASEPEWGAQQTPPAMESELLAPLRAFYGLGPASIGAAGDNNHLYGRHRSYAWDVASRFCTNRAYGTTDERDQGGNRNFYRAFDVGIQGAELQAASRRMDALARSGRCPGLAEWFGTFDGETVVGWYEGHESTSDDSHLYHLHGGLWTESADDAATMRLLYATITSANQQLGDNDMRMVQAADDSRAYIYDRLDTTVNPARPILYEITGDQLFTYGVLGVPLVQVGYINWDMFTAGTAAPPPTVVPVEVDAAAVAAALIADPTLLPAIAEAVADEEHRRSAD